MNGFLVASGEALSGNVDTELIATTNEGVLVSFSVGILDKGNTDVLVTVVVEELSSSLGYC